MLLQQRRAIASVMHRTTGGQNLNMAPMVLDGQRKGHADPAHNATDPITLWAKAVWNAWRPYQMLVAMVDAVLQRRGQEKANWRKVTGPAAALAGRSRRHHA